MGEEFVRDYDNLCICEYSLSCPVHGDFIDRMNKIVNSAKTEY